MKRNEGKERGKRGEMRGRRRVGRGNENEMRQNKGMGIKRKIREQM